MAVSDRVNRVNYITEAISSLSKIYEKVDITEVMINDSFAETVHTMIQTLKLQLFQEFKEIDDFETHFINELTIHILNNWL